MRVFIVHNPQAGDGKLSRHELISALEAAGHDVTYDDDYKTWLREKLSRRTDVVIAAGGDGTIIRVATVLAGQGIPMPPAEGVHAQPGRR